MALGDCTVYGEVLIVGVEVNPIRVHIDSTTSAVDSISYIITSLHSLVKVLICVSIFCIRIIRIALTSHELTPCEVYTQYSASTCKIFCVLHGSCSQECTVE